MSYSTLKQKIDTKPLCLGWEIVVFVCAMYMIQYIRAEDTNKIIDLKKQLLLIENREGEVLKKYPLEKIQAIEVLKFQEDDYVHYELNLRFPHQRINLYASRDDLLTCQYAQDLSNKLHKPVEKLWSHE